MSRLGNVFAYAISNWTTQPLRRRGSSAGWLRSGTAALVIGAALAPSVAQAQIAPSATTDPASPAAKAAEDDAAASSQIVVPARRLARRDVPTPELNIAAAQPPPTQERPVGHGGGRN